MRRARENSTTFLPLKISSVVMACTPSFRHVERCVGDAVADLDRHRLCSLSSRECGVRAPMIRDGASASRPSSSWTGARFPRNRTLLKGSLRPYALSSGSDAAHQLRRGFMAITRYNPWHVHGGIPGRDPARVQPFLHPTRRDQSNVVTSQWTPRVDIKRRGHALRDLRRHSGRRSEGHRDHDGQGHPVDQGRAQVRDGGARTASSTRIERSHGLFYRRFALPDSADAEGISATGKQRRARDLDPEAPRDSAARINVNR